MAGQTNMHSTVVAWLKVALPLVALAMLSTLFLFSNKIDPSDAIPFADVDIADRIREPRLTMPTWAGVTDDGADLTISASDARQQKGLPQHGDVAGANATALIADLLTPDGATTRLVGDHGVLDTTANSLFVQGGVTITTSTGYELRTEAMTAALDRTSLVSNTDVEGDSPMGTVNAGAMELRQSDDGTDSYVLILKNRVKLIYQPPGK